MWHFGDMADIRQRQDAPPDWLDVLAESEKQRAAGETVPAEVVHQRIRDGIARIAAKRADGRKREATQRR